MTNHDHMSHLRSVLDEDERELIRKEETYQGSWKRRGGVGAFMVLARKWDRLESILELPRYGYDIFEAIGSQSLRHGGDAVGEDGTVLAEVRDLRRYLALVEAEMIARGAVPQPCGQTLEQALESMEERLVPRMRKFADEYQQDPFVSPGTPEDGGHHARQAPDDDDLYDGPARRMPTLLTRTELESLGNTVIPCGTMAGELWRELYAVRPQDGRPEMTLTYREEYGR